MPQKLYTADDMGSGLQIANSPDPTGLQDVVTKHYVDDYHLRFGRYQTIWELEWSAQAAVVNYVQGTTHIASGGFADQTITKLFPETGVVVAASMSFYISDATQVKLMVSVGGGAIVDLCGLYPGNTGEHMALPFGFRLFPAGSGNYMASLTGALTVAFYLWVGAAVTVSTDQNDFACATISEVRSGP
jgi:hypothetical protein